MKNVLYKKIQYANAIKIKPIKNRSTLVCRSKDKESVIVTFRRADCAEDELKNILPATEVLKGKIMETQIKISRLAALALWKCLEDYFEKIEPNLP